MTKKLVLDHDKFLSEIRKREYALEQMGAFVSRQIRFNNENDMNWLAKRIQLVAEHSVLSAIWDSADVQ